MTYSFFLLTNANAFLDNEGKGAQSTGREDNSFLEAKNSNLKKGKDALKQAIKYKKKNKIKKSTKRLDKSIKYFVSAYKENPDSIEVLNYLGFTYHMIGDMNMSEIYYQQALAIDPKNFLINQKLGELYLDTGRLELAKERLKLLSPCDCEEFFVLKKKIEKKN